MTTMTFVINLNNTISRKGALLYSPDGSMCALRGRQPGQTNVRAALRHSVPYKGLHPLRRLRVYPCPLYGGNNLLTQTIPAAKSENPISLTRPSTDNVGDLFLSIYLIKSKEVNHAKTENPC